jgi:hypothetical protein
MATYRFRLILNHPASEQDTIGETLFCGGRDEFSVTQSYDLTALDAEVESDDFESAIRTAISAVGSEGFGVAEVQISSENFDAIAGLHS